MDLDQFIEEKLAQIDDFAELKVTLVALHLLRRNVLIAEREVLEHPAVQYGFSFPLIATKAGLNMAVARGNLISTNAFDQNQTCYLMNTESNRKHVEVLETDRLELDEELSIKQSRINEAANRAWKEISRLETLQLYSPTIDDRKQIVELVSRGYSLDEIVFGIQRTLAEPRRQNQPPRGFSKCLKEITAQPPQLQTFYYRAVVAKTDPLPDEIIAFRELTDRLPSGHEFDVIQAAVSYFGSDPTVRALVTLRNSDESKHLDVDELVPFLMKRESTAYESLRRKLHPNMDFTEIQQLYTQLIGVEPTPAISEVMMQMFLYEVPDKNVWKAAFNYAARRNKRSWAYVRNLVEKPFVGMYTSAPVNQLASNVFKQYEAEIGPLTAQIAEEINTAVLEIPDQETWFKAFKATSTASDPSWSYMRAILLPKSDMIPVNDTARFAFEQYRKFVGKLSSGVAKEINSLATQIADIEQWQAAFTSAEVENKRSWRHIKDNLVGDMTASNKQQTRRRVASGVRPQVEFSDAERAADEESARQRNAEREKLRNASRK